MFHELWLEMKVLCYWHIFERVLFLFPQTLHLGMENSKELKDLKKKNLHDPVRFECPILAMKSVNVQ